VIPIVALTVMLSIMLIELQVSRRNERTLRARGAVAAFDPVYPVMRVAYPALFVAMAAEGLLASRPGLHVIATSGGTQRLTIAGAIVLVIAKGLKVWAIRSLDGRWTFRVFVLLGVPLVHAGPYRWLRHPNYVAVVGELIGFALLVSAPLTGIGSVLIFGELLRRRIRSEEQALDLR
jgi:methyltransferase